MIKKLYVVVGEMGSGKTTIVEKASKELNIPIVKTTTTRPKRDNEDDEAYNFVSDEYFEEGKAKFIEIKSYDTIYGKWYYGLEYSSLQRIDSKEAIVILTPKGYKDLVKNIENKIDIELFYVYVPTRDRISRIKARGDMSEEIMRRIKTDKEDFKDILDLEPKVIDNSLLLEDSIELLKKHIYKNKN